MYRELLLGCGHKKEKRIRAPGTPDFWQNLTTLDINPDVKPDWCYDFEAFYWRNGECHTGTQVDRSLFAENEFDEIHAYEFLEHIGHQGYHGEFFQHFTTLWLALKPGGYLCATTPSRYSPWLWGDPGHRRAIIPESLTFLDQTNYVAQQGRTSMSDYRYLWHGDFKVVHCTDDKTTHTFILQAIKPARV